MTPEQIRNRLMSAETGKLTMPEQVELVNSVGSLQETNRKLNRRAQDADVAFKQAMIALQHSGWVWRGGNFGRAMLAYYSTQLEYELKQLREAMTNALGDMADYPDSEPDWAAVLRIALAKPTESVADDRG